MTTALVLLSGGQDSTTCLYWAKHRLTYDGPVYLHTLSVHYGQRHAVELDAAAMISRMAGAETHREVDLSDLFAGGSSDLLATSKSGIRPGGGMKDHEMPNGLPTSFVPGRNLLLLAAAVARAGAVGATSIVTGVCQTDYSGYPDCRSSFIHAMNGAIGMAWPSNEPAPTVVTPLMNLTKAETVKLARELPGCWQALKESVTCYYGRPGGGCGECPACYLRRRGFDDANEIDPATVPQTTEDTSRRNARDWVATASGAVIAAWNHCGCDGCVYCDAVAKAIKDRRAR